MAIAIHVPGAAPIKTGTGAANALELLGYSLDGVELDFQDVTEPVYADTGGGPGMLPIDEQEFGEIAIISARIVVYDETVLAKLRKRPGAAAEGAMGPTGQLIGTNNLYYRLLVDPPLEGLPWNFPTARLIGKVIPVSSKRNIWQFRWRALAFIGAATSADTKILYNRTNV